MLAVPLLALLLSGCFRFDVDFVVSENQTVSGSMIFGFHRDTLDFARQFDENATTEDLLSESGFEAPDVEGVTSEPYEDESYVGVRYRLDQVPLDAINEEFRSGGDADPLQIVYQADRNVYEVSGTVDLSDAAGDGEDVFLPPTLMSGMEMRIALTFPGEIIETNGEVSGTTVTWRPQMGEITELHAVASASGSGAQGGDDTSLAGRSGSTSAVVSIVVALAVLLVVLAVVLIVWLSRRNRGGAAPVAPGAGPTVAAPGAGPAPYATPPTQAYPPSGGQPPAQPYPPASPPPPPGNPQ